MTQEANPDRQMPAEEPQFTEVFERLYDAGWRGLGVRTNDHIDLVLHIGNIAGIRPRRLRKLTNEIFPDELRISQRVMGVHEVRYRGADEAKLNRVADFLLSHTPPQEEG